MSTIEIGEGIMSELMGEDYLPKRAAQRDSFNDVLQDYSAEVCFGRVWSRDGLDRKLRSVINIAMLVALNRPNQLRHHLEGALNNGCSVEEIKEILLQTAVYCGLPAASDGFRIADELMRERGLAS
ncbi:carboxymuconolactone decarboxylase family protein [Conexibacter sp. S30A1]|uniref:carboxymuconolactone decarboxylase family protein n=1 Tax=Conexibacter sp. S30A1 TaxID=2937800 RepID=UPI00200E2BEB|nr:carboxymuconolactone decarboxylase family protein [Conexibacter sp. S30A1]